jgi:hypothetical protein
MKGIVNKNVALNSSLYANDTYLIGMRALTSKLVPVPR